jgi:hypothetical protein
VKILKVQTQNSCLLLPVKRRRRRKTEGNQSQVFCVHTNEKESRFANTNLDFVNLLYAKRKLEKMEAEPSSTATTTRITDLNEDSLAHCATYLSLQDLSNLATTCKSLKRVAYSDPIWQHCFRFQESISLFFSLFTAFVYLNEFVHSGSIGHANCYKPQG